MSRLSFRPLKKCPQSIKTSLSLSSLHLSKHTKLLNQAKLLIQKSLLHLLSRRVKILPLHTMLYRPSPVVSRSMKVSPLTISGGSTSLLTSPTSWSKILLRFISTLLSQTKLVRMILGPSVVTEAIPLTIPPSKSSSRKQKILIFSKLTMLKLLVNFTMPRLLSTRKTLIAPLGLLVKITPMKPPLPPPPVAPTLLATSPWSSPRLVATLANSATSTTSPLAPESTTTPPQLISATSVPPMRPSTRALPLNSLLQPKRKRSPNLLSA